MSTGPEVPYLSPPQRCARLERIVADAEGVWERRSGETQLEYALPAHATPEVRDYLRPLARVRSAPEFIARLPAGRVFGSGVVLSADGKVLARDVSADFGKTADEHWLLTYAKIRPPVELTGPTTVVAVNRGAGYCHWLLEELPRLLSLPVGEAQNLVTHAAGAFAREALALRGGGETVVEPRRTSHFACAPLIVPGLAGEPGAPTPEAVRRVLAFTEKAGHEAGAVKGGRVYFSRAKAARRRVVNEDALWDILAARGFERFYLEELGWAEQIAVCRRARVVVAPHGAGLANLVFCAAGTRVVELVNRAYFNPTFWRLAALCGLDYRPVVAPGADAITENRQAGRLDIEADLAQVGAALAD